MERLNHHTTGQHSAGAGKNSFFRPVATPAFFKAAANVQRKEMPEIQRESIDSSCNTSRREYIMETVTRAYGDLTAVLPMIRERPVPENVNNALWMAFRDRSPATADNVLFNIRRLQEVITSARFSCANSSNDSQCTGNTYGHAPRGDLNGVIVLCDPKFFEEMSVYAQSRGVIHEAAHIYLSMRDRGYFMGGGNESLCTESAHPAGTFDPGHTDSGTEGDNPAYRLENADAYGCFVHMLRNWSRARLSRQSAAYRGDNLSIATDDITNDIYTESLTPQIHTFRIAGAPVNSGFRFRWRLSANGTDYTPTAIGGSNAAAFLEENREVYVSAALRQIFLREGLRRVTLTCEIALYGPGPGGRHPSPVITKTLELGIVIGREPGDI
ncbi:MAG TPA: hypothetical protein VGD35_00120 [Chitinophaga sp.]